MSWSEVCKVECLLGKIHKAVKDKDSYYIRCLSGTMRVDLVDGNAEKAWDREDTRSFGFLPKGMLLTNEAFICNERLSKNCYVIQALDKKNGQILWKVEEEKELIWASHGEYIAYSNRSQAEQIKIISSKDGSEIFQIPLGQKDFWIYNSLHICDNTLYHRESDNEKTTIFTVDLGEKEAERKKLVEVEGKADWYCCGSDIYLHSEWPEKPDEFAYYDGKTDDLKGKTQLPEEWKGEIYSIRTISEQHPGKIIFRFEEEFGGIACVDILEDQVKWYLGDKGKWRILSAEPTPRGIVAFFETHGLYVNKGDAWKGLMAALDPGAEKVEENSERKTYLVTIDVDTGEFSLQEMKAQYALHWCEDVLFAGGTGFIRGYKFCE